MPSIAETIAQAKAQQVVGDLAGAERHYRHALQADPANAEADYGLGVALAQQGRYGEAVACFQRVVALTPDDFDAHHNLGAALEREGRLDDAVACLRQALKLRPDVAETHNNLGGILTRQGNIPESVICCRRAVALKPDYAKAHHNLGAALSQEGKTDEALECFRKAMETHALANLHSNTLHILQYQPNLTLARLAAAHRQFDERHAAPFRAAWKPHANSRDPDKKLRLGFVSADLGFHPVGYFLVRALENLDRQRTETICYSDRRNCDTMTLRLRAAATTWRDTHALDDQQMADQIRAGAIDILFDLAGHTANNRLLVFARKPAPVQITWMGYVGTTGLKAMDYLLADRHEVPETAEPYVVERVLRLPDGYVCYDPPRYAPNASPLPALQRGYVTFGCFNDLGKLNSQVVDVWARILRRLTAARLVLKCAGLDAPSAKARVSDMFAQRGVESPRLVLLGASPHADLLRQYQGIDIALDPFPYNGGLTTCEALWMGVPVVTCPGETFAGRHSLSHLSNVGLTETIATDLRDYVELAAALAADLPRLSGIRARLRRQMADSPLCDGKRFSDNLARLCRDVWRSWCESPTVAN